jgi:hypothetical protein
MRYTEWLKQQTVQRQEQSLKLLEISRDLGKANREDYKQAKGKLEQDLKKKYIKRSTKLIDKAHTVVYAHSKH